MNEVNSANFSVLMSVYKNDNHKYFKEALDSIYSEQTLKPSEIILVADGKISFELISVIDDFKTKYPDILNFIQINDNVGLASALNYGLEKCNNDLIARMDSDDISLATRFEIQYHFMEKNYDVSVSGTFIEEIEPDSRKTIKIRKVPLEHTNIVKFAKRRSPVSHPSVMFRKSVVIKNQGYPNFRKSQDYALWSKLLVNGEIFANIPQILLKMRTGNELQSRRGFSHFKYEFAVLKFQYTIGFVSKYDFLVNFLIRFILRMTPLKLRVFFYSLR